MTGRRRGGVEVWFYSSFNLSARWGLVVNAVPQTLYPKKNLVPLVQKARWAPRAILEGAENLAHHESSNPLPSSP